MNAERTIVVICRHGNVDNPNDILYYRVVDVPLSSEGHLQMQRVGEKLKEAGIKPRAIYTSILTRAVQSAAEIAKSFPGVKIIEVEDLQDPDAPGIEKKTNPWLAEIEAEGHDVFSHPELKDTIETREQVADRMVGVLGIILKENRGETAIIVSHGDPTALMRQRVKSRDQDLPTITEIKRNGQYLEKGQALSLVFDSEGQLVDESLIE